MGALLTYYLRDNVQGDAKIVLTVTDSAGKQVRQIDASNQAGLHRTPWDLREPGPAGQGGRGRGGPPADDAAVEPPNGDAAAAQPADAEARRRRCGGRGGAAGGGGGRGGRGGPLVKPGTYTVQLGKLVERDGYAIGRGAEGGSCTAGAIEPVGSWRAVAESKS